MFEESVRTSNSAMKRGLQARGGELIGEGGLLVAASPFYRRLTAVLCIGALAGVSLHSLAPASSLLQNEKDPAAEGFGGSPAVSGFGDVTQAAVLSNLRSQQNDKVATSQHYYHHHNHTHLSHHNRSSGHHQHTDRPWLLPQPMALLRQNVSLLRISYPSIQSAAHRRQFSGNCSCLNPQSPSEECCSRSFFRTHKMGSVMTNHLFERYKPTIRKVWDPHSHAYAETGPPTTDFRDVLLLRNLWDALASGYLFHSAGEECDTPGTKGRWYLRSWERYIKYELDPPSNNRTMCQYLADEDTVVGMRAYMDWVFHYHYRSILSHWALAEAFGEVLGERTRTVCYEDMMNPQKDEALMEEIFDFFYNGTAHEKFTGIAPGHVNYTGTHSTTHNASVREHLIQVARRIDEQYYDAEIAWADSVLPC